MKQKFITGLVLIGWLTCGYFAHGLAQGASQRQFPYQQTEPFSTLWGYGFGPIALGFTVALDGPPYNLAAHEYSTQQRWDYFHKQYPSLSLQYFTDRENNGTSFIPVDPKGDDEVYLNFMQANGIESVACQNTDWDYYQCNLKPLK